jgi:hypothetical protein
MASAASAARPTKSAAEVRSQFRAAWQSHLDAAGRFHSRALLALLQDLQAFSTTINVGKREAPRWVTYHGVPNDAMFLLKSLGYADHEIAIGVYLDFKTMERWFVNHVSLPPGPPTPTPRSGRRGGGNGTVRDPRHRANLEARASRRTPAHPGGVPCCLLAIRNGGGRRCAMTSAN